MSNSFFKVIELICDITIKNKEFINKLVEKIIDLFIDFIKSAKLNQDDKNIISHIIIFKKVTFQYNKFFGIYKTNNDNIISNFTLLILQIFSYLFSECKNWNKLKDNNFEEKENFEDGIGNNLAFGKFREFPYEENKKKIINENEKDFGREQEKTTENFFDVFFEEFLRQILKMENSDNINLIFYLLLKQINSLKFDSEFSICLNLINKFVLVFMNVINSKSTDFLIKKYFLVLLNNLITENLKEFEKMKDFKFCLKSNENEDDTNYSNNYITNVNSNGNSNTNFKEKAICNCFNCEFFVNKDLNCFDFKCVLCKLKTNFVLQIDDGEINIENNINNYDIDIDIDVQHDNDYYKKIINNKKNNNNLVNGIDYGNICGFCRMENFFENVNFPKLCFDLDLIINENNNNIDNNKNKINKNKNIINNNDNDNDTLSNENINEQKFESHINDENLNTKLTNKIINKNNQKENQKNKSNNKDLNFNNNNNGKYHNINKKLTLKEKFIQFQEKLFNKGNLYIQLKLLNFIKKIQLNNSLEISYEKNFEIFLQILLNENLNGNLKLNFSSISKNNDNINIKNNKDDKKYKTSLKKFFKEILIFYKNNKDKILYKIPELEIEENILKMYDFYIFYVNTLYAVNMNLFEIIYEETNPLKIRYHCLRTIKEYLIFEKTKFLFNNLSIDIYTILLNDSSLNIREIAVDIISLIFFYKKISLVKFFSILMQNLNENSFIIRKKIVKILLNLLQRKDSLDEITKKEDFLPYFYNSHIIFLDKINDNTESNKIKDLIIKFYSNIFLYNNNNKDKDKEKDKEKDNLYIYSNDNKNIVNNAIDKDVNIDIDYHNQNNSNFINESYNNSKEKERENLLYLTIKVFVDILNYINFPNNNNNYNNNSNKNRIKEMGIQLNDLNYKEKINNLFKYLNEEYLNTMSKNNKNYNNNNNNNINKTNIDSNGNINFTINKINGNKGEFNDIADFIFANYINEKPSITISLEKNQSEIDYNLLGALQLLKIFVTHFKIKSNLFFEILAFKLNENYNFLFDNKENKIRNIFLNDNQNEEFDNNVKMTICEILENMIKMHNFKLKSIFKIKESIEKLLMRKPCEVILPALE
jgi:hypothetical protein